MGTKLSPCDAELYQRVDEVLHYLWDPIGVAGIPEARDEYNGYLPTVFALLTQGDHNDQKIVDYLVRVATDRMGLDDFTNDVPAIVSVLTDWKRSLQKKHAQNS